MLWSFARFIRASRFRKFGGRVRLIGKRSPHNLTLITNPSASSLSDWTLKSQRPETLTRLAVDEFRRGGTATVEIRDLARETVYIVQSFRAGRGTRLLADPSVACKSELAARRTAARLAQSRVGVIAWSRTGDAELGDFDEEPVVFFRAGRIPAELDE